MTKILIVLAILFTVVGQLMLKHAVTSMRKYVFLISGYALFFITVCLSYLIMKRIDLKYFTVIMSVNYFLVSLASAIIYKERMSFKFFVAVGLVVIGVFIFNA